MEKNTLEDPVEKLSNNRPMLHIAGLLLIIAGALAIITWISVIATDVAMIDISLFQRLDSSITNQKKNSTDIPENSQRNVSNLLPQ